MIFNVTGGGGGTSCTLTITAPVGATVTVSKDGKSKPSKVATTGTVVFKGLETGTWTITITNGTDTASKTVEIKADYQAEITFFSATINITYPAGLTCTATDGSTTLTAPDTSGTWACVVPNAGTWTITAGELSSSVILSNTDNGGSKDVIVAWWVIKDGALADIAITKSIVSGKSMTVTEDDGYVKMVNPGGYANGILSDAINLANATKIVADINAVKVGRARNAKFNGIGLVCTGSYGYSSTANAANGISAEQLTTKTGDQTLTIDISEISTSGHVGFAVADASQFNVYNLYAQ